MTDARMPEKWLSDRRLQRLTDRAYRAFVCSLMWSVSNRTDGRIDPEDLSLIPGFGNSNAEDELAASGLWLVDGDGWVIEPFASSQTSAAEHVALEKARASNRERQARFKANHAGDVTSNVSADVTANVTPTVITQDRTGQALPVPPKVPITTQLIPLTTSKDEVVPKSGTSPGGPEKPKRATRLPDGWYPPKAVADAMKERFPHVDLKTQHELFCNYWHSKGGRDSTKVDWVKTWSNWIIKAANDTPTQSRKNGSTLATRDLRVQQAQALKTNGSAINNNRMELE